MFGINFGRQGVGKPIVARTINQPTRQSEQTARISVGRGLAIEFVAGIPLIRLTSDSSEIRYAVITTLVPVANRSTKTLGKGMGTLQAVTYSASDVGTYDDDGDPVPIYSGSATGTVAVGRLVIVGKVQGRWSILVDYC